MVTAGAALAAARKSFPWTTSSSWQKASARRGDVISPSNVNDENKNTW
jgi:hypothetical protein